VLFKNQLTKRHSCITNKPVTLTIDKQKHRLDLRAHSANSRRFGGHA